jgi:sodium transport system permease protein
MNKSILITIKKELRGILREKKSLMTMLAMPLLVPFIIFSYSFLFDSMVDKEKEYNVGITYEMSESEEKLMDEFHLKVKKYDDSKKAKDGYNKKEIDAYITKEDNKYTIYTKENSSNQVGMIIEKYFEAYNNVLALDYLNEIGANPEKVYSNITYTVEDISGGNMMTSMIVSFSIMFAMMAITMTAITCATDIIAGEKEKGTLETILTFPIKSTDFIMGKYISIVIVTVTTTLISLVLMAVSLFIASNTFSVFKDISLNIDLSMMLFMFLVMIAFSLFISGATIALASKSKTYKEAQSSLQPLSFITMVPMFMNLLGYGITTTIAFIPGVGPTVLLDSILNNGIKSGDMLNLVIVVLSTLVYAIILVKYISIQYKKESVLFS